MSKNIDQEIKNVIESLVEAFEKSDQELIEGSYFE